MTALVDFLAENQAELQVMQDFSTEALPDTPEELASHLSRAQGYYARCGFLLADVESHLVHQRAQATLEIHKKYEDLSAQDRKNLIEDEIRDVKKVRDVLEVTVMSLKQKAYACMNLGRIGFADRPRKETP